MPKIAEDHVAGALDIRAVSLARSSFLSPGSRPDWLSVWAAVPHFSRIRSSPQRRQDCPLALRGRIGARGVGVRDPEPEDWLAGTDAREPLCKFPRSGRRLLAKPGISGYKAADEPISWHELCKEREDASQVEGKR
jgi:hypothetical protein